MLFHLLDVLEYRPRAYTAANSPRPAPGLYSISISSPYGPSSPGAPYACGAPTSGPLTLLVVVVDTCTAWPTVPVVVTRAGAQLMRVSVVEPRAPAPPGPPMPPCPLVSV